MWQGDDVLLPFALLPASEKPLARVKIQHSRDVIICVTLTLLCHIVLGTEIRCEAICCWLDVAHHHHRR